MSSARQTVARRVRKITGLAPTEVSEGELSSSDQVVQHITSNILAGRYVPGQRLVEADLTQTLRVSRGPVREAFRRLDALGILSRIMHRGACVRTSSRKEAEDLLLAAEPLAALAVRLAAERFAEHDATFDASRFERELRPFRDRKEDIANILHERQHFYDVLVEISGNSALPSLIPTMRIHLLRIQIQSFFDSEDHRRHLDDYAVIARAVLAGDSKGAEKGVLTHLRRQRALIVELPDAAFPTLPED